MMLQASFWAVTFSKLGSNTNLHPHRLWRTFLISSCGIELPHCTDSEQSGLFDRQPEQHQDQRANISLDLHCLSQRCYYNRRDWLHSDLNSSVHSIRNTQKTTQHLIVCLISDDIKWVLYANEFHCSHQALRSEVISVLPCTSSVSFHPAGHKMFSSLSLCDRG